MLLRLDQLEIAAHLLRNGKLVAFPTETVYGLGACIFNPDAIRAIFKVKGRPSDNPLIAHVSSFEQVYQITKDLPDAFFSLANFFPGPLTVVLKRCHEVPSIVSAGLDTIAVRMPSHQMAHALIDLVGQPLVAPSANLSGKPSATMAEHVIEDFADNIAAVVDGGKTEFGIESTVISLLEDIPILLRPGAITKDQIEKVLGYPIALATSSDGPVMSPGMKYRHYAPKTPIQIFQTLEDLKNHLDCSPCDKIKMVLSCRPLALSAPGLDHYALSAKELYSLLRLSDARGYEEILILCDEEAQKESALMNRLLKAAGNTMRPG